jgi:outer membrane protein assembly factor BamD (BamD/ComL family)
MSPAELIQRAQEATDRNRYKVALQYYQALHDRNRSNIDLVITAEYEIAFIHYKQKNYAQARADFNAILEYYNTPDQELLPQHFKRLSQIVLQRIDDLGK